jgi:hypothetical protein
MEWPITVSFPFSKVWPNKIYISNWLWSVKFFWLLIIAKLDAVFVVNRVGLPVLTQGETGSHLGAFWKHFGDRSSMETSWKQQPQSTESKHGSEQQLTGNQ